MTKLGKLYELMAYGDDLDAFYSMNKRVTKAGHTECDREIMDLLNEAKKEFPHITDEKYRLHSQPRQYFELEQDRTIWFKKWFGEP
jgi:hypothetical protein